MREIGFCKLCVYIPLWEFAEFPQKEDHLNGQTHKRLSIPFHKTWCLNNRRLNKNQTQLISRWQKITYSNQNWSFNHTYRYKRHDWCGFIICTSHKHSSHAKLNTKIIDVNGNVGIHLIKRLNQILRWNGL